MAKEKDNKNNYKPLKNPELIEQGTKKTVKQLVADGNQWKKENFGEHIKAQEQQSNRPAVDAKIAEKKKALEKGTPEVQPKQQEKKIEKDHNKDR